MQRGKGERRGGGVYVCLRARELYVTVHVLRAAVLDRSNAASWISTSVGEHKSRLVPAACKRAAASGSSAVVASSVGSLSRSWRRNAINTAVNQGARAMQKPGVCGSGRAGRE